MYLRLVWGKLRPGTWDEYERHYYEKVVPSDRDFSGIKERRLLRCATNPDEGISLSLWDTLDDLVNYERSEIRQTFTREVKHLYQGEYWVKSLELDLYNQMPACFSGP